MKLKFLLVFQLFAAYQLSAQLMITSGSQFIINGNQQVTLKNTDLINNGNFKTGNGIISFTGNVSSSISGSQPVQLNELEINKTNNTSIILKRAIDVSQSILFTSGFINLNGFNANLDSTGQLDGEQETSRIIGNNGGEVLFNTNLNAPINSNPAGLGLIITSKQNFGNVIIRRGHQSQNIPGKGFSVLRYYDIIPANNSNLNATLSFKYFDGELNNLDKNSLQFCTSYNGNSFTNIGFALRDIVADVIKESGINSLGRFTLSDNSTKLISNSKTLLPAYSFYLFPNPTHDIVFINIVTKTTSQVEIKVFDNKGTLAKLQKEDLHQGDNKLSVNMSTLVNGIYNLAVDWDNGQMQKTMQVLKL